MGARLGIGDLSRMRLPFESRFSQYTRTTFCSSLAATSAVLTDCELKFQNISDCLRRLIAPLLLRGIFFLSPGLSFFFSRWLPAYVRTIASSTRGERERGRKRWWSFIFSIGRFFGAFSSRVRDIYIGGRLTASDFDKSYRVSFTAGLGHAAPSVSWEIWHEKKQTFPWLHGNLCASKIDMTRQLWGMRDICLALRASFRARLIYYTFFLRALSLDIWK